MATDRVTPLATVQSLERSTLKHVFAALAPDELRDVLIRATRACENACGGRRLAPFTGLVETHRAGGVDPAMAASAVDMGDVGSVTSSSYARVTGGGQQVRKVWLDQRAPCFPDLWTYSDVTVRIIRPEGSTRDLAAVDLLDGPDPETGAVWFRSGTYLPVGALVKVTYSGGYTTVPGDLAQACRYMAAADVIDEDDYPGGGPRSTSRASTESVGHSDAGFVARAWALLIPYGAGGGKR